MSQTFDIKRFGKMLRHDVRRCSPTYGTVGPMMISLVLFVPLMTLVNSVTETMDVDASYRLYMMTMITLFDAASLPLQLYANIDKRNSGIYYAMLPASKLEKYLSIAILSLVVVPVAVMAVNVALDTLLVAVHAPYYSQYLWQSGLVSWLTLPVLVNCLLVFVGATLGFIFANGIKSSGWRNVVSFLLWMWLVGGMIPPVFLDDIPYAVWVVMAVNALIAAVMATISWNKTSRMGY